MITHILRHDGVYLGTIVQEGHTTLPIYPHLSYVFNPIPSLKGVWIQEGSLWSGFTPQEPPSGGSLWHWLLLEGSGLPSSMPSPPCHLTVSFPWNSLQAGNCGWNVLGCYSSSSAFYLLGHPYSPCQANHKLFWHSFDSTRIITLLIFIITSILF